MCLVYDLIGAFNSLLWMVHICCVCVCVYNHVQLGIFNHVIYIYIYNLYITYGTLI
jgi:hypothetical protein